MVETLNIQSLWQRLNSLAEKMLTFITFKNVPKQKNPRESLRMIENGNFKKQHLKAKIFDRKGWTS